jgi:hypothetical protein
MILPHLAAALVLAAMPVRDPVASPYGPPVEAVQLYQVTAPGKLHFVDGDRGCPNPSPACVLPSYLVPGDRVVVIAVQGDYARAVFVGGAPAYRETIAWLPLGALASESPGGGAKAWLGAWHTQAYQDIDITLASDGRLRAVGSAVRGAGDPAAIARGAVYTGDFDETFAPADRALSIVSDDNCEVRARPIGPYLLVADNQSCGGLNVTFSGLYRRGPAPKR